MPQAVWTGTLSFGLINIPIKLYAATSPKRVRFHQYEAGTGRRIRYRRVAQDVPGPRDVGRPADREGTPADQVAAAPLPSRAPPEPSDTDDSIWESTADDEGEVAWEDVVKGYEVEPGRVVVVDDEELESIAPERSRLLALEGFVDLQDIDPVFFDKSYYVVPQPSAVTHRPYRLLYRAMESAGKVGIGRFVMRTKEYLVAVRPAEHVLMLETLFYADEVRDVKDVWTPAFEEPSEQELTAAQQFLEAVSGRWDPDRHRDEHRERLLNIIEEKAARTEVTRAVEPEAPKATVTDLMEALQASVDAARRARQDNANEA